MKRTKNKKKRGEERQRDGLRLDTSLGGSSPGELKDILRRGMLRLAVFLSVPYALHYSPAL